MSRQEMHLETKISARFVTALPPASVEEAKSLLALNYHAEQICETLQPIFQKLVIDMLELKRAQFTAGGTNATARQTDLPSDY